MPSAIKETVGDAAANSYVSMAEATTYFDDRTYSGNWTAASPDDRTRALLWAARIIDSMVQWKGQKTTLAQAMDWPRAYVPDPDVTGTPPASSFTLDHWYLDSASIPKDIKDAQCEQALALLGGDPTVEQATDSYSAVTVGPISVALSPGGKTQAVCKAARALVSRYGSVQGKTARLIRT